MADRNASIPMGYKEPAALLGNVLVLSCEPIAVKFFEYEVPPDGFELPSERRYCQVLMSAREEGASPDRR